jgi:nucleotide-binding universal stress UspA family protein
MAYPYRSILIPLEFDDPSLVALDLAKQIAMDKGATVHLLHVDQILPAFGESDVRNNEHSAGEEKARAMLMQISKQHLSGAKYEIHTVSASARALAKAIVHVATEVHADLIVLRTHGRKGLSRFILGNVAEEVVRTAPCPVQTLNPAAQEKFAHLKPE